MTNRITGNMQTDLYRRIFNEAIDHYHLHDDVDHPMPAPYSAGSVEMLLFHKNWIDTVQWHLEDIIRDPAIDPMAALLIKRRIDASNQDRTDKVEFIDSYFLDKYKNVKPEPGATLNTETLAWAIDRFSILELKIYHMRMEAGRKDLPENQRTERQIKLEVLLDQEKDLSLSIEQLLVDVESGKKYIKTYKQMKMYNDPEMNPVLYGKK